jgi:Ser/Thr protein kinase RdoA (MazF antagonist)
MDKRIRELYNDSILDEALARYGVAREDASLLDGFESFIYECGKGGERYALRVSHSLHRTSDAIQGELEWVNYLADGGVPAARAVRSEAGNLVEPIPVEKDGSHFTAVAFEWAPGDHATREAWRDGLPVRLGRIMGRMHALTKDFQPSEMRFRRHTWYEDAAGFVEQYLPPSEVVVIDKYNRLVDYLCALPHDRDSYGLIHVDVHGGNFFVDEEGQITLFDFDDCQYSWFANDIAMSLFYAISHDCVSAEDVAWAKRFLTEFLEGYRRENGIGANWPEQIPHFLKLREIDLYAAIHRSLDLDDLDPWCASYMKDRNYKIEHDVPYVVLDWGSFA